MLDSDAWNYLTAYSAQSAEAIEYTDFPNECPSYDTKESDGETQVMPKLWEERSALSLHRYSNLKQDWPRPKNNATSHNTP